MSKVVGDESGVAELLPQPGGCGVAQRVCADVLLDPGARGGSQLARETCRHRLSPWLPTLAAADEQRALRPSSSRSRESSAHSSGPARPLTSASSASRSRSARPGRFPSGRPAARGSLLNSSRVSQSRSCRGFGGVSRSRNGSVTPRVHRRLFGTRCHPLSLPYGPPQKLRGTSPPAAPGPRPQRAKPGLSRAIARKPADCGRCGLANDLQLAVAADLDVRQAAGRRHALGRSSRRAAASG